MISAILAGMLITMGAALYLKVGGAIGATLFSLGLLTILYFKFALFTGRAGLLVTREIKIGELAKIWLGNFIGCIVGVSLLNAAGLGYEISEAASRTVAIRESAGIVENMAKAVFCGMLMYIAVNYYERSLIVTIGSVAAFILLGAAHCVADMAYMMLAQVTPWTGLLSLGCVTIGNVVGCNIIPGAQILKEFD